MIAAFVTWLIIALPLLYCFRISQRIEGEDVQVMVIDLDELDGEIAMLIEEEENHSLN